MAACAGRRAPSSGQTPTRPPAGPTPVSSHDVTWPGLLSGRAAYDTPFYNGGGSELRAANPAGLYPSTQMVCIESLPCSIPQTNGTPGLPTDQTSGAAIEDRTIEIVSIGVEDDDGHHVRVEIRRGSATELNAEAERIIRHLEWTCP